MTDELKDIIRDMRYVICGCGCVTCNNCNDHKIEDISMLAIQALNEIRLYPTASSLLDQTEFNNLIGQLSIQKDIYGMCCKNNTFPFLRKLLALEYTSLYKAAIIDAGVDPILLEEVEDIFLMSKMENCFINCNAIYPYPFDPNA